jgi:hypothetical protein
MPDIAALQLTADSKGIRDATVALREMAPAATAAEKASQRWGLATNDASRSVDDFSRRVQGTLKSLAFEQQQLTRTAAEQAKYAALKRAGVTASSAEGQAIAEAVAKLQAHQAATKDAAASVAQGTVASRAGAKGYSLIKEALIPLAAAFGVAEVARKLWEAGMKAGDLGEQADQIGITTDQLQAYRFAGAQAGIETEQMDIAITKLAKSMGTAADGNKEMIDRFAQLGVKLLDAKGELRPVADVLPEVARGVLNIGSTSQRTATLMDLFGKSGAKMTTVLEEFAKGNDAVVASAAGQGGILDREVVEAWDRVKDAMVRAGLQADVTNAKLGAPIATAGLDKVEQVLKSINGLMEQINSRQGFWSSVLEESQRIGLIGSGPGALRLETPDEKAARQLAADDATRTRLQAELRNPNPANVGREAMIQADIDRLNNPGSQLAAQGEIQAGGVPSSRFLPRTAPPPSVGTGSPKVKGGAGSDPYASAIESAKEYTALKIAETAAIGLNVGAAEQLKHEQELINKASKDANTLTPVQIANLKGLAAAMAEADSKFATAKFMDDASKKSAEFIAAQEIEQKALWMSAEAADAYRIAQTALNDAKSKGIDLSAADVAKLREQAAAQAAASQKTRDAKELYDLAKDSFTGFITDIRQGLMDGKSVWETFGNAATNALDKISSKLLEMAAQKLFESAFGGSSGGGGLLGSLFGGIFGGGAAAGGGAGALAGIGSGVTFANGAAFRAGNVIPFARGGVVGGPTLFPMANGMGLMGEAGPEAVMPLRRGPGGRLGVSAHGGGSGSGGGITVVVTGDTDLVRVTARDEFGKGIRVAGPQIEGSAVKKANKAVPSAVAQDHATSGGDWRLT